MKTIKKFDLYVYLLSALFLGIVVFLSLKVPFLKDISTIFEGKTFDLRQKVISNYRTPKTNPVKIVGLDTKSYEFLCDKFGSWPIERKYWAYIIENLEKYNPNIIVMDFMFPKKSSKGGVDSDLIFSKTVNTNENVVMGMLFDYESERNVPEIPPSIISNIKNGNIIEQNPLISFSSYQPILIEILNSNKNIASVNITREQDGITRYMPVFIFYNDSYFKTLSTLSAFKY